MRLALWRPEKQGKRNWNKVCWGDEVTFEIGDGIRTIDIILGDRNNDVFYDKNLQPRFMSGHTSVGIYSLVIMVTR